MRLYFTQRNHLVGIGGAGMCGLGELLHHHGHTVTGSDQAASAVTRRLESLGVAIQYGHEPDLVKQADLVIYSSAIKENNPERKYARENAIAQLRRADALGQLMRAFTAVCVAGTHGKTTTTSLLGAILNSAGLNPTVLVGGTLRAEGAPVVVGDGRIMVAEADEYDRSFLAMYPTVALITNIEADHLDCYRDLDDIKESFVAFARRVPFFGAVVCCIDDAGVRSVASSFPARTVTYGLATDADYRAETISFEQGKPSFDVIARGERTGRISLGIPGMHNVLNALGATATALEMGVPFAAIQTALAVFGGVKRRFEIVGSGRGVTVVDDYAHHPGEIRATLEAARRSGYARVIAVFQPHLYSRTRDFLDAFAESLSAADAVVVTDIYKAREEPIAGVSAEAIVQKLLAAGHRDARYIARKDAVANALCSTVLPGDVVVVMGAGDINGAAFTLVKELRDG
jgi:UDP-N-acetylmuramate--alanine ligase